MHTSASVSSTITADQSSLPVLAVLLVATASLGESYGSWYVQGMMITRSNRDMRGFQQAAERLSTLESFF